MSLRGEGDCRGRRQGHQAEGRDVSTASVSLRGWDPISQTSGLPGPFSQPFFSLPLAVDSRVSQELHYTKEKLGEEAAYTSQMLIQTARQEGENVLTPEALGFHLQAALTASKVQVSLYGK